MAQQVNIVMVDDVDGSEASETVTFGLDGVNYEIDLNLDNAARLRSSLKEWTGAGRRVGGGRSRGRTDAARSSKNGVDSTAVREWARNNGHEVSERGRIKADVLEAYRAADGG